MGPPGIQIGNPDVQVPTIRAERGTCGDCGQWEKCLFHLRRHGGFKTRGKKNVGYRLVTDKAEDHGAKEDFVVCVIFVDVLQDRMLTGQQLRAQGKDGEIIQIIAQEGDEIEQRFQVGFNARNQVIRPMPHLVASLKASGYAVNLDDQTSPVEFRPVTLKIVIPPYRAANIMRDEHAHEIAERARLAETDEEEAADQAWASAKERHAKEDAKPSKPPIAPQGKV